MKHVVITGSTRGIGFYMALEFLKAGCTVTLSGRSQQLPECAISMLSVFDEKFIYVPCNVQDKNSLQHLWDVSQAKWKQIDIWINNAGQNTPYLPVWKTSETFTQAVITTNLTGMIYGSQIAAAGMIQQGHGAIYSMEGLGSNQMIQENTILYGTSKCALTYFMKGLALELKDTSVIAGRLSPGMMLTDFITKDPEGFTSAVMSDERFKRIFNILADKPETVAAFFIPRILNNTKNDIQIAWLTNRKAAYRFLFASFRKNRLIP